MRQRLQTEINMDSPRAQEKSEEHQYSKPKEEK